MLGLQAVRISPLQIKGYSPGAQGSKMSRAGPKGLKVVSNWKFCADSENQRLTCRTWEVFQIRRYCCHGNNSAKN